MITNAYQAGRYNTLDTLTSGHEVWLDDQTLVLLSLARNGVAVRLPMSCGHSEDFNVEAPARLRQYASQKCTRCILFDLARKENSA